MFGLFKNMFSSSTDKGGLGEKIAAGAYLVDVRTPAEFARGSVPGAVNIPLGDISRHLKKFKGKKSVIVFCRSGARSGQAKRTLERHGIRDITNGGSWQNVNNALRKSKER